MLSQKMRSELGMKAHALKHRTDDKMFKTHHSTEYCSKCGTKTRSTTTHESGHREFDHVDAPKGSELKG